MRICSATLGAVSVAAAMFATAVQAQDAESFFKGKSIDLIISTGVGGGLDTNARLVAKHMPNYIPGKPSMVPKNMPGAGHVRAANYLATQAAKDGTVMGTLIPAFVTAQVLNRTAAIQFDAEKFQWLGSTASSNNTLYVATSAGVNTIEDTKRKEVTMGGTGAGSYSTLLPIVMNNLFGTKFKVISGYQSTADVGLALERGEVQGRAGNNFNSIKSENPALLRDKKIVIICQFGLERDPEFPDIPLAADFAKNAEERQIMNSDLGRRAHGAAVPAAASRAGRSRRGVAQGVRRHGEGPGLSGRRRQVEHRRGPAVGRQAAGPRRGIGRHAGRGRREDQEGDGDPRRGQVAEPSSNAIALRVEAEQRFTRPGRGPFYPLP